MSTPALVATLLPWSLAHLALLVPTALLWRRLRPGSPSLDAPVFVFLHALVLSTLVMVLGLAGLLRPLPAFVASLLAAVVLGTWRSRELARTVRAATLRLRSVAAPERPTGADAVLLAFACFLGLRIAAHVWWLPPYVRDTLSYHLPKVAEWIRAGALVVFETPIDRTYWPGGFELLQAWSALFPHHDFAIELAGVGYWVLACLAVGSLARTLGLSVRDSRAAALVYGATPACLQHATTCKNDLPIAALALLLFALVLDGHERWTRPRRRLLLIASILAVGAGTKPTLVFVLPGVAFMALGGALRRRSIRGFLAREVGAPGPVAAACLLATGGLLAGYWFLRNGLLFGNPFHPAEPRIFGEYLFGAPASDWERQGVFLSSNAFVENARAFVSQKIFDREAFHFSLTDMTGWGWFAFACGWPAVVVGISLSTRFRWLVGGFLVSLATVLASVVSDPWHMRFALWFPAVFAIGFFLVLRRLPTRRGRAALGSLAAVCIVLNLLGSLDVGGLAPADWSRMAGLPLGERSSARLGLFFGTRFQDALDRLPEDEPLGYTTNYNGFIYPLYGPDFTRDVRYVPLSDDSDLAREMKERGVRWLFASLPPPEAQRAIIAAGRAGTIRRAGEELFVLAE